ncbi:unnamed protein product [Rhodiola kirilowii]
MTKRVEKLLWNWWCVHPSLCWYNKAVQIERWHSSSLVLPYGHICFPACKTK